MRQASPAVRLWLFASALIVVTGAVALVTASGRLTPQVNQPPYRILVTNDDGVRAPGLQALVQALQPLGELTIVAPAENQSGKGHSISITDPIYADTITLSGGLPAFALAATPVTCVQVAMGVLMREKPNLVVSGINNGSNLGMVTYVSGTVGAAREAALRGIPAIAASLSSAGHPQYEPGAKAVARIVEVVKQRGLERGVFLNVNVPPGPESELRGIRVTTQSGQAGTERFEERRTPGGRRYFWSIFVEPRGDMEGSDVWATANGYVAVTPLRAGEFDTKTFDTVSRWSLVAGR